MSNTYNYGYTTTSQKSLVHHLIFPVDAWNKNNVNPTFESLKSEELKPVLAWVIPIIVLVAGFSLGLGFFSSLFFYGMEAAILAVLAKFYLKFDTGQAIELFFNFWVSFLCIAFVFMFVFGLLSIFIDF
jgi:hypothetical protein